MCRDAVEPSEARLKIPMPDRDPDVSPSHHDALNSWLAVFLAKMRPKDWPATWDLLDLPISSCDLWNQPNQVCLFPTLQKRTSVSAILLRSLLPMKDNSNIILTFSNQSCNGVSSSQLQALSWSPPLKVAKVAPVMLLSMTLTLNLKGEVTSKVVSIFFAVWGCCSSSKAEWHGHEWAHQQCDIHGLGFRDCSSRHLPELFPHSGKSLHLLRNAF